MVANNSDARIAIGDDIFRVAVENTPTGVCITNESGIFEYANKAYCTLYEYSIDELIGKSFTIVVPDGHKEQMQRLHDKYIAGTDEVRGEWDVVTKSGNHLTILSNAVRVKSFDGRFKKVTFITDITERIKHEQELQNFYVSIETSSVSIYMTDSGGVICYANPAFCKITGYLREEALGRNIRIVKSGVHDQQFYKDMRDTLGKGKPWQGEICNKNKSGELFWESTVITPIPDKFGKIVNYVAINTDISQKIDLERLKEDVARILQHDLRTSLNSIIALPQIMKDDGKLTTEQTNDLEIIEMSGRRMLRMINSSLDIFKMEEGTYQYNPKLQDIICITKKLSENLQDCSDKLAPSIGLFLDSRTISLDEQFIVLTEEIHFSTMFSNLLMNAIEASPSGKTVFVNFKNDTPKRLSITNNGVVPNFIREHFFEKYKTYGKQHGTGLGTYSAKLIATAMNYRLEMQTSDESNETTVTIIFCEQ